MLIAEIQGKFDSIQNEEKAAREVVRMEDVLTSNFFGIIKNIDSSILNEVLKTAGIEPFRQNPVFDFWRKLKYAEPDLIISAENRVIIVEMKFLSPFDEGDEKREHQIVRELKSAIEEYQNFEIEYLAVTRNEGIVWSDEVKKKDQWLFLQEHANKLHHVSWENIYEITRDSLARDNVDPVSRNFLQDLKQFFEVKQIGYQRNISAGERDFEEIFGEESEELFRFISEKGFEILLIDLEINERIKFYSILKKYVETLIENNKIAKLSNSIDLQNIPIDLLFNEQIEETERQEWMNFINFLFSCEYVNLNGKNNISASIKFKKGNFANTKFSLFTYFRKDRKIKFQDTR